MSKFILVLGILFSLQEARSSDYQCEGLKCTFSFEKRAEGECSDLNPEMGDWFRDTLKNEEAPINKILGEVRNQGSVGWCFAHAAADMMTAETGFKISAAQVARNYYDKSILVSIFRYKEGGFIDAAIKLSFNKPLCEESKTSSTGVG
ncbi:MAG: hypothetical protein K2Q18_08575, partial [Bdellovibrionales bacterium]|nr:hypothetical protein [Bdellovibrionales bacterium]